MRAGLFVLSALLLWATQASAAGDFTESAATLGRGTLATSLGASWDSGISWMGILGHALVDAGVTDSLQVGLSGSRMLVAGGGCPLSTFSVCNSKSDWWQLGTRVRLNLLGSKSSDGHLGVETALSFQTTAPQDDASFVFRASGTLLLDLQTRLFLIYARVGYAWSNGINHEGPSNQFIVGGGVEASIDAGPVRFHPKVEMMPSIHIDTKPDSVPTPAFGWALGVTWPI